MPKEKLKGIGGWLILPTLGLIISALAFVYWAFNFLLSINTNFNLALFGFVVYGIIAFLNIFSLFLEFKYRKEFPKWAIITLWSPVILLPLFLFTLGGMTEETFVTLGEEIIATIIWTAYFLQSKRVKNTFVNQKPV